MGRSTQRRCSWSAAASSDCRPRSSWHGKACRRSSSSGIRAAPASARNRLYAADDGALSGGWPRRTRATGASQLSAAPGAASRALLQWFERSGHRSPRTHRKAGQSRILTLSRRCDCPGSLNPSCGRRRSSSARICGSTRSCPPRTGRRRRDCLPRERSGREYDRCAAGFWSPRMAIAARFARHWAFTERARALERCASVLSGRLSTST